MSSSPASQSAIPGNRHGAVRTSNRLSPPPDVDTRTPRADGWTPSRIRTFLDTLAECGVVADAARAAGMSKQSAYAFRNSARGRAFDTAWRAALLLARRRLADEVMSRALNGCVEVIIRDGEVWGERHRFDNRLTMAVLTRLDALADSIRQLDDGPRRVAHEFEAFVDSVCAGDDEAAEFVRARAELPFQAFSEAQILERNAAYLCAREQGRDVEWQLLEEPPSEIDVAPGVGSGTGEPDQSTPDRGGINAIDESGSDGADRAGAEPLRCALDPDQPAARAAEDRPDAGQGDDEWQPSTSSTSLDLDALVGVVEPGADARPSGARMTAPHSVRANRVQPATRVKSCVVRSGGAAIAGSPSNRLVPPYGAPG